MSGICSKIGNQVGFLILISLPYMESKPPKPLPFLSVNFDTSNPLLFFLLANPKPQPHPFSLSSNSLSLIVKPIPLSSSLLLWCSFTSPSIQFVDVFPPVHCATFSLLRMVLLLWLSLMYSLSPAAGVSLSSANVLLSPLIVVVVVIVDVPLLYSPPSSLYIAIALFFLLYRDAAIAWYSVVLFSCLGGCAKYQQVLNLPLFISWSCLCYFKI